MSGLYASSPIRSKLAGPSLSSSSSAKYPTYSPHPSSGQRTLPLLVSSMCFPTASQMNAPIAMSIVIRL